MKLFFRRMGQGNPVVILHGLFGLSDNWVTFGRQMAKDFDVIIPDLRNHGQSPHSDQFNYPVLVDDLHTLISNEGLSGIHLIGHSLGGKIAMLFALKYPEMVNKLVIVDITLRRYPPNMEHKALLNAMLSVDLSVAHSRSDIDRQLISNVPSLRLRQFLLKNIYWKDKETLGWRLNLNVLATTLPSVLEAVSSDTVFMKPVLLVRGEKSTYVSDEDITAFKKIFPRTLVKTLENASHWVHADVPGEFYSFVYEFLRYKSIPVDLD
jgi:esterase